VARDTLARRVTGAPMPLVLIGRIGRPHGVEGEMYLDGCSLTPLELNDLARFTWRGGRDLARELELLAARPANTRMLVRFKGTVTREAAAELTNGELLADSERLPDPGPGQVYYFQLVGLEVRTEDGRVLGTLADILPTGAHPVYIVRGERELLIPAAPDVIRNVDLAARTMTVALPAGLEEAM
jgi:16S rRNA processing protein RimM